MSTLDLARTQFGVTTLFHFIFVPMSIGLAAFVALCQTCHYRTGRDVYLRMTRFWGKFMLISVAIGVVTGIVQEFQFGMNWSLYSKYVGDIFGAPTAPQPHGRHGRLRRRGRPTHRSAYTEPTSEAIILTATTALPCRGQPG